MTRNNSHPTVGIADSSPQWEQKSLSMRRGVTEVVTMVKPPHSRRCRQLPSMGAKKASPGGEVSRRDGVVAKVGAIIGRPKQRKVGDGVHDVLYG